jgi:hypothetical protein
VSSVVEIFSAAPAALCDQRLFSSNTKAFPKIEKALTKPQNRLN